MGFKIEYGDITNFKGDAIINSLGTDTVVYGKLCDAIVKADDNPALESFLKEINGKVKPLDIYITDTNYLSSKHIIHIVTPYRKDDFNHKKYIVAYINALNKARENHFYKLAVPLIGTGPNGYSHTIAKKIVESLCKAYSNTYKEMDITVIHHGSKTAINDKRNIIVDYDIDVLKDRIMIVKTEEIFGDEVFTYNFTKDMFINPPYVDVNGYTEEERTALLRQKMQDDFHKSIVNFTEKPATKCIYYIQRYLDSRYGKDCTKERDDTRLRIRRLFGGGKKGSSVYGHLCEEDINFSKIILLKTALGCQMNAKETGVLLEAYGYSLNTLTNREQAIYAFITQKLYDIDKIEKLLNDYYSIWTLEDF